MNQAAVSACNYGWDILREQPDILREAEATLGKLIAERLVIYRYPQEKRVVLDGKIAGES